MRSNRRARVVGLLAGMLQLGLATGVSAQSDALAWEPADSVKLTFDATEDPAAAHGSAILRNPSPLELTLELRLVGDEKVEALTLVGAPSTIDPGSAVEVDLTVPGLATLVGLKGSIVAEGRDPATNSTVGPAVVAFEIVAPESASGPQFAEPAAVTMTVDRCWPSLLISMLEASRTAGVRDCLVYWPPGTSAVPDRPTATVTIHGLDDLAGAPTTWQLSGDAGVTEVAITEGSNPTPQPSASSGLTASAGPSASPAAGASASPEPSAPQVLSIQVAHPGEPGKYSGDIPVSLTTKDAPTVVATVHVQDFILWPILTVALGAILAYLLIPKRDQTRMRDVLDARLVEIFELTGDRSCHYKLGAFPIPDPPAAGDPAKTPIWPPAASRPITPAEQLHIDIYAATSRERLDDLAKKVEDLAEVVVQWQLACKRRTALRELFDKEWPAGVPAKAKMGPATEKLLDGTDVFTERKAATDLATLLGDQAEALKSWLRTWSLVSEATATWEALDRANLPPEARKTVTENRPAELADKYLFPAEDLAGFKRLDPEQRARDMLFLLDSLAKSLQIRRGGRGAAIAGPPRARAGLEEVAPPRSSKATHARIVRDDLIQLALLTAAAAVVYLSVVYPGKDFGSPWQYATALLAGMTGAIAIKWELLPWQRSYRPSAPKV